MLREELKMIAGVVTEDMDYIGYLLLKDGVHFKRLEEEKEEKEEVSFGHPCVSQVPSLDSWFNSIGG